MKLNLRLFTPSEALVVPVLLMALLLVVTACGLDSSASQADDAVAAEEEKMAAEKVEAETMAMEERYDSQDQNLGRVKEA